MKLLVTPHNDDESLWTFFTCMREKPLVLVIFDGHIQQLRGEQITAEARRAETLSAMKIAGCEVEFAGFSDAYPPFQDAITRRIQRIGAEEIYAPAFEVDGHEQHNLVARACDHLPKVRRYLTYTKAGKSASGVRVEFEREWPLLKLQALACYRSQVNLPSCQPHFLREQYEYMAA